MERDGAMMRMTNDFADPVDILISMAQIIQTSDKNPLIQTS
jgi:hypothetical protein